MNSTGSLSESFPQTGASTAGIAGRERRQYIELLRISLWQGFRPAINESGKKSRPLRTLSGMMLMFGFLFLVNARFYADIATYFTLIFTSALSIQLIGVFPVRTALETAIEVLHCKPISDRVHMAASISQRILFASIICTFYAAIPLIASRWYFSASWSTIAGTFLLLIVLSVSILIIVFSVIVQLSAWSSYEKLKAAAKYLFMAMTLVAVGPGLAASFARGLLTARFSIWSYHFTSWFPPVWFATFLVLNGNPFINPQRVAVITLVCVAISLCFRKRSYSHYSGLLERMNSAATGPLRLPVVLRIASVVARASSAQRRLGRPFALASVMLLQTNREESFGLRKGSLVAVQGLFFVLFLLHPGSYILLIVTAYGLYNVFDGVHMVSSSSFSSASWLFGTTPASPKQIIRGMEVATFLGNSLLPSLLVSISLYYLYRPALATALVLVYMLYVRILISIALILHPRLPLSGEITGKHGLGGLLYSIIGNMGFASILLLIVAISRFSGSLGLVVSLGAIVGLTVASLLMNKWACHRMAAVESSH